MSRQNNNSPVPQEAEGLIQNIDILNNNNEVANGVGDNDSHGYSTE
jgi:hypothetical protein